MVERPIDKRAPFSEMPEQRSLADKLRAVRDNRRRQEPIERVADKKQKWDEEQRRAANEILAHLSADLERAASRGESALRVMKVERDHYDDDLVRLARGEIRLEEQVEQTLKGAPALVAEHLRGQGLTVGIEVVHNVDKSEGRSWNTVYLTASW